MILLTLSLLLGCDPLQDCSPGDVIYDDGECRAQSSNTEGDEDGIDEDAEAGVDVEPPGLLDNLVACDPLEAGEELDLDDGCYLDVCVGMTFAEIDARLTGGRVVLTLDIGGAVIINYVWDEGIGGDFSDADGDGAPDPAAVLGSLSVTDAATGTDPDGLGVGASMRCFLEGDERPTSFTAVQVDGEFFIQTIRFGNFTIADNIDENGAETPDGLVDQIWIYSL